MRKRCRLLVLLPATAAIAAFIHSTLFGAQQSPVDVRAILKQYCVGCHNQQMKQRGSVPVALDNLDLSNVGADAKTWEMVVRKMRAGVMPPAGMPRPEKRSHESFLSWLEGELDRAARANPNPGRTEPIHRLNRSEYQNAVRDLLNLEIDVASLLPPDDASYGFDNIAGVLKISPTLMERYLSAAQKVSRAAVGVPPSFPNVDYFRVADDLAQDERLPGQLFGTRGGTSIRYTFPMDAYYSIGVQLSRDLNEQVPIYVEPQQLELSIDGERVQLFTLTGAGAPAPAPPTEPVAAGDENPVSAPQRSARPGTQAAGGGNRQGQELRNRADKDWEIRVPVKAGVHNVQVAFIKQTSAVAETARLPFLRPYPAGVNIAETRTGAYLRSVEISGPYDPAGPGNSPSRRQIFICRAENLTCARKILGTLARRAYHRPVTDADLQPLLAFYREGRKQQNSFDNGIERALRRLLVSPEFLFRVEADPPNVPPNTPYRVGDLEIASRLSFFLWSSIPDEELLGFAEQNRLRDPAILDRQIRRMIADPRFSSFVEKFAGQWLFLRNLAAVVPVQQNFPDFDDTLRQSFRRETELFFESIVREDRSALDLLRADYTFLNERLARHYGIPKVKGSRFRRVSLPPDNKRGGLLSQGSILTVTSYPDRTSPVVRGKWILENLLGTPPPPPLPNVPPLKPPSFANKVLSMRERISEHRKNAVCASCHAMMDPLGLALENFDGTGRWRDLDESGVAIDASGSLPDGTKFVGADGLTKATRVRSVCHDADREDAHVCARARRRVLRCARCPNHRARSGARGLPLYGAHPRYCAEHGVPNEEITVMIITKMALPRRTFLRGMGTALGLPLLDAMVPALSAMVPPEAGARRIGFIYMPNGVAKNSTIDYWTPTGEGKGFELSQILAPLAPFRDRMVVVSGLDQNQAETGNDGASGDHTRGTSSWLTGVYPKRTEGADVRNAVSADQIAVSVLGKDTALPSLELAIDLNFLAGQCENSYSCVYLNTLSWTSPTTPLPTENNPRIVFERLFGDGGTAERRAAQARQNQSILDSVLDDLHRVERRLGPGDRTKVTEYVDAVREVERRIQGAEDRAETELPTLDRPKGIPERFDEHVKLMYELQWLAFRADLTRVVTFMLGRDLNFRTYPEIGVTEGHHGLSHHQDRPEQIAKYAKVGVYQAQLFAGFLEKLQSTSEADGTVFDHSLFLYGAGLSNPNTHAHIDLPLLVVGGRDSRIEGNRHLVFPGQKPMTNLLLSLLDRVGVHADTLGDSNGRIEL